MQIETSIDMVWIDLTNGADRAAQLLLAVNHH